MAPQSGLEPLTYRLEGGCCCPTELLGHMAEAVGFEPTRRLSTDLSVFKTDLFSLLSTPPYVCFSLLV